MVTVLMQEVVMVAVVVVVVLMEEVVVVVVAMTIPVLNAANTQRNVHMYCCVGWWVLEGRCDGT